MLRDIENLLMVGPDPKEEPQACGTCGARTVYVWTAADALRVRVGEDWEYKAGALRVKVCANCAKRIHGRWIVMPGEAPDA